MKKQLKLLFFVALLVTLVVMTMVMASAAGEYQYTAEDESPATADTLADAVANAKAGSTITLLSSVTEINAVTIEKNLTIKGTEGAVISVHCTGSWVTVKAGYTCSFEDLTVKNADEVNVGFLFDVAGIASFTRCSITNKNMDTSVMNTGATRLAAENASITMTGCYVEGLKAVYIEAKGVVNLYEGTYLAFNYGRTGTSKAHTVESPATGAAYYELNIYGGTFNAEGHFIYVTRGGSAATRNGAKITIDGGNFTGTSGGFYLTEKVDLTINNGTFESKGNYLFNFNRVCEVVINGGKFTAAKTCALLNKNSGKAELTIRGGEFEKAPTAMIEVQTTGTVTVANATMKPSGPFLIMEKSGAVTLGDGVRLEISGTFGEVTAGTVTVGAVEYYAYSGSLPSAGDWSKATFYTNLPEYTLPAGNHTFASYQQMYDLATADDNSLELWGKGYAAHKYLPGAAPRFVVGEGVVLTITGGTYENLVAGFLQINGGTAIITGGTFKASSNFASSTSLVALNDGGMLSISGNPRFESEWTTSARLFYVTGGTVEINCDSAAHTPAINDYENDYASANQITDANFHMGGSGYLFVIENAINTVGEGETAVTTVSPVNITVKDGVFLRRTVNDEGGAVTAHALFYFTGTYEQDIESTLTIKKGYFYATNVIRLGSTTAKKVTVNVLDENGQTIPVLGEDGQPTVDAEGNPVVETRTEYELYKGTIVNIEGGTFVSAAVYGTTYSSTYMFQVYAPGKHEFNVAENADVEAYLSKYTLRVFYVNNGSLNYGAKFNILGGKYSFTANFFYSTTPYTDITFVLKNATLNQIEVAEGFYASEETVPSPIDYTHVFLLRNTQELGESTLTLENVTITATNGAVFGLVDERVKVTVISGTFIGKQIVENPIEGDLDDEGKPVEWTAPTLNVLGGTFVQTGKFASVFAYENAAVSNKTLVLAPADTVYSGTKAFDQYSPVVKYADVAYKFWTALEAQAGAPVIESGAGIYLGADGAGADKEECGIRFNSSVSMNAIMAAENYTWTYDGESESGLGHIIAPADYVAAVIANGGAFTHKDLEALGEKIGKVACLDIPASVANVSITETEDGDMVFGFSAAIYSLNSDDRAYAAIPYAKVIDNETNEEVYLYGAYDAVDNSRSAVQVANYYYTAKPDVYNTYAVLQAYYTPSATEEQ